MEKMKNKDCFFRGSQIKKEKNLEKRMVEKIYSFY